MSTLSRTARRLLLSSTTQNLHHQNSIFAAATALRHTSLSHPATATTHALRQLTTSNTLYQNQSHVDQHAGATTTGHGGVAPESLDANKAGDTIQQPNSANQQQNQQTAPDQQAAQGQAAAGGGGGDKRLTELEAKVKELTDARLRAMAETENVRTRGRADLQSARLYAIQGFAKSLLEVCDTLELMEKNAVSSNAAETNKDFKALLDGVQMTSRILHKILEQNGMKRMSSLGERFDPYKHEVLFQVDDPSKEPNVIAQVMREGYSLHDRTLRAAQVGTVKKRAAAATTTTENKA